jgi:hypothetical protein
VTFAHNSLYLTMGGELLNGTEHWMTGFHFSNLVDPGSIVVTDALKQIDVGDVYDAVAVFFTTAGATGFTFPVFDSLDWVKVAPIGKDGKYLGDPIVHEKETRGVGTTLTYAIPPQLAVCVSLWSGSRLGKANHGRSYWPLPSNFERVDTTSGLLNITAVNLFRDEFLKMLHAVSGEISTLLYPTEPVIMSSLGSGTTKPIKRVGVGYAADTMRSRRRDLLDDVSNYVDF